MSEIGKEIEDYFCKFTFGQFVTLAILELATLFFVFYLGAHYGPELLGTRMKAGEVTTILPSEEPKDVQGELPEPNYKYTFPELLTDGEGGGPVVGAQAPQENLKYDEEKAITSHAVRVKPSEIAKYTLQVGSYPSPEEASKVITGLQGRGYDAFMSIGKIPDRGTWYRVRVGSFGDKKSAEDFKANFTQKEKSPGIVVLSDS